MNSNITIIRNIHFTDLTSRAVKGLGVNTMRIVTMRSYIARMLNIDNARIANSTSRPGKARTVADRARYTATTANALREDTVSRIALRCNRAT